MAENVPGGSAPLARADRLRVRAGPLLADPGRHGAGEPLRRHRARCPQGRYSSRRRCCGRQARLREGRSFRHLPLDDHHRHRLCLLHPVFEPLQNASLQACRLQVPVRPGPHARPAPGDRHRAALRRASLAGHQVGLHRSAVHGPVHPVDAVLPTGSASRRCPCTSMRRRWWPPPTSCSSAS